MDIKDVKTAVKLFNRQEVHPKLKMGKNKKIRELLTPFIEAVNSLTTEVQEGLPTSIIDFINNIPVEYFSEEVPPEPKPDPKPKPKPKKAPKHETATPLSDVAIKVKDGTSTKRPKKRGEVVINGQEFFDLVNSACLNGVFADLCISIENGVAGIYALHSTNSVFVRSIIPVQGKMKLFGIPEAKTLVTYLKTRKKKTISMQYDGLKIALKDGGNSTFSIKTCDTEFVRTHHEDHKDMGTAEEIIEDYDYSFIISKESVLSIINASRIVKPDIITFGVGRDRLVYVEGGESHLDSFREDICFAEAEAGAKPVTLPVFGEHLLKIFGVIDWNFPVEISLNDQESAVISNNENYWIVAEVVPQ